MTAKRVLFCLLGCALSGASAAGTTYYVSPEGTDAAGHGTRPKPFKTIRYAVQAGLKPGDIVALRRGTYHEQVTLSDLSGTAEAPVTLKAIDGPKTATVLWQNPDNRAFQTWPTGPAVIHIEGSSHIVLDGLVVSGGRDRDHGATWAAVGLVNSSFCTVQDCVLQNAYMGWEPYPREGGVAEGNRCLRTVIRDNGYVAMLQGEERSFAGYGVYIGHGANRNVVDGCDIYDNCAYGLQVKGQDNIVRNCRIHDNGRGTRDPQGRPFYSNGNASPSGGGLTLNDGTGGLFYNNLIFHNVGWGIAMVGYDRAGIYNNTIFDNNLLDTQGCGISTTYSGPDTGHRVRNNILLRNRGGAFVAGYAGTFEAFAIEDHNYVDDDSYRKLTHGPAHTGTIQTMTIPFLSTAPKSRNFLRLNSKASPSAVDAGADLTGILPAADIVGAARSVPWDIGAYEYKPRRQ